MRTGATFETSAPRRSEVIKCVAHLRAFALLLTGDCQRADDLVRDTILQPFAAAERHDQPEGSNVRRPAQAALRGAAPIDRGAAVRAALEQGGQS